MVRNRRSLTAGAPRLCPRDAAGLWHGAACPEVAHAAALGVRRHAQLGKARGGSGGHSRPLDEGDVDLRVEMCDNR
jgi:hypothetical protein